jgi:uncharacterized protein YcfJ
MEVPMTARFMAAATLAMLFAAAPNAAQAQSLRDRCEDYAYRIAYREGSRDSRIGESAVGGAVVGGVLGAILGEGKGENIVGGAIAGTAAGTLLGAAGSRHAYLDRRAYRRAYSDCINRNRVVRVRRYDDAVEYCLSRYRSYNPDTGYYRTYAGTYRRCP